MLAQRLKAVCFVAVLLLAACASPTPTATVAPAATSAPTAAATALPAATATAAATGTPSAIGAAAAHDVVPASQINPQTQARLRLAYYVADGPNVDLIVNGAIAVNGDQAQVNIPPNYAPGYLYLPPGTYSVAVVPTGQGLAQALVPPTDVPVAAGHRYTLAVLGQATDKRPKAVVIDETDAALKAGIAVTDSARLWINTLGGATGIDISGGGGTITTHVDYGGYALTAYPAGDHPFNVVLVGVSGAYFSYDQNFSLPATTNIVGFVGAWGKNSDYTAGPPTSELNVIDYLQSYSGQRLDDENYSSFSTLLKAIQTAGLTDLLTKQGPHLFLAPNDAAFKRLPAEQLAALMADPKALADLLRNHIAAVYVPKGALAKTPGGPFSRSFTNLLGNTLAIGDGYSVNGLDVGGDSVFLADGTQIHAVDQVLLPPSLLTPTPAPTQALAVASVVTATASGRMVYAENTDGSSDAFQEIWIMNADGSGKTRLTNNAYYDAEPALSPDGKKIAYTSAQDGNNNIFVMNADGSGATNLTKNSLGDGLPRWSPDGKKIVFSSNRDGNDEVYVMNADGSGQKRLTNNPGGDGFASFSSDGKRIAFGSEQGGAPGVYLMNADGSGQKLLTTVEDHTGGIGYPAWSPNSQQIAFATNTGGNLEIYVIGADGSGLTRLTNDPADDYLPAWSPDGTAIAFTAERGGSPQVYVMNADGSGQTALTSSPNGAVWPGWAAGGATTAGSAAGHILYMVGPQNEPDSQMELYLMNADGSHPTQLTNDQVSEAEPALSPDGTKIAFDTNRDGNQEIYVMNADGSGVTRLTNNTSDDEAPAWSPDGKKIAFGSRRDGNWNVYVMNADGSGETRLTDDPANDDRPAWSPDGKRLAFSSDRGGLSGIYVMQADGSGQTVVAHDTGNDAFPAWSPDGKLIAFNSDANGGSDIYVIQPDGTHLTRLTTALADGNLPTWSPDGKQIAFTTGRDGHFEVYVMNADGSNQKRLTTVDSNAWWASWGG